MVDYRCTCDDGYEGNGVVCTNINECDEGTHNCNANAMCTDAEGNFTCTCNLGYTGDGIICSDINECDARRCDQNATCNNTIGSFVCTCNENFIGDGLTVCNGKLLFDGIVKLILKMK